MTHLDRICSPAFLPTNEDILRAQVRTTGIFKRGFVVEKRQYEVWNVGGERSKRKKWIHNSEDVQTILFFVPMSCYDEALFEDHNTVGSLTFLSRIPRLIPNRTV